MIDRSDPDPLVVKNLRDGAECVGVLGDELFFPAVENADEVQPEITVQELLASQGEVHARN